MNLFIVSFREAVAHQWQTHAGAVLNEGDVFVVSPYELIVRLHTEDPSFLTQAFSLYGDASEPVAGVVFKLNGTYAGYHAADLWDWLAVARKDHVPI